MRPEQKLDAVLHLNPGARRRTGAEHPDVLSRGRRSLEKAANLLGIARRLLELIVLSDDVRERGNRRIMHQAPEPHLLSEETLVVLLGGQADGIMFGKEGLYEDAARRLATAGASCRLGEKLERTLGGAEVGQ